MQLDTIEIRRLRDQLLATDSAPRAPVLSERARAAVLKRIEPFAELMYLVMMADGRSEAEESATATAALRVLSDEQLSDAELAAMLDQFADRALGGVEARIAQLGAQLSADPDDRETALALAAVVAVADRSVAAEENQVVEWVVEYLGVSRRRLAQVLGEQG